MLKDNDQLTALAIIFPIWATLKTAFLGSLEGPGTLAADPIFPKDSSHTLLNTNGQLDTVQQFLVAHIMFPFLGIFPMSRQMFPRFSRFRAIFRLPRIFPAGHSRPTRSTLISPYLRMMTSRLPWRQFGDNFSHLSYSENGPFWVPSRAPGPFQLAQPSEKQLPYSFQQQPDT